MNHSSKDKDHTGDTKKVLVIAYHFPPLAGAGMLKILRTVRYLSKYNWSPVVLTVKNPEPYHRSTNAVPSDVEIYRSWRIPGGHLLARLMRRLKLDERWLLLPDQHLLWIPCTFFYGIYLMIRKRIDLIYVTGPPYSALIAGALLKTFTGKALVVDVRDPWSFNAARRGYPSKAHRLLDRIYEKWVLRTADHITCIYHITANGYYRLYDWTKDKISVFYDTVDLADLPAPDPGCGKQGQFVLTYLGTFYPPFISLKATLEAIKRLMERGEIEPDKFCFNYVGPVDFTFNKLAAEYGLTSVIRQTGYKPIHEALKEAAQSEMLLLLLEFATINTKLFDYLATGNTILAVVPEFGELDDLLRRYADRYYKITDFDHLKIAESIKQCYNDFQSGKLGDKLCKRDLFLRELNIERETEALTQVFSSSLKERQH